MSSMIPKSPGEKVLSSQGATITVSEHEVTLSCNSREDAEAVFAWLCSLCDIEKEDSAP